MIDHCDSFNVSKAFVGLINVDIETWIYKIMGALSSDRGSKKRFILDIDMEGQIQHTPVLKDLQFFEFLHQMEDKDMILWGF